MISRGGAREELLRFMRYFEILLYSSLSREATDVHERPWKDNSQHGGRLDRARRASS